MADGVLSDLVVSLCSSCCLSNYCLYYLLSCLSLVFHYCLPEERETWSTCLDVHSGGFGCLIIHTVNRNDTVGTSMSIPQNMRARQNKLQWWRISTSMVFPVEDPGGSTFCSSVCSGDLVVSNLVLFLGVKLFLLTCNLTCCFKILIFQKSSCTICVYVVQTLPCPGIPQNWD